MTFPLSLDRRAFLSKSAAALALTSSPALAQAGVADFVLTNGRITTMDPARPDATALAVRDGTFIALGSEFACVLKD